jgi:16S rRNA C1402 (ribose-2'-O) methylase RsmI
MIVPTPIGNLKDLSPKILKALYSADLIGCEDRRVAGQLYHLIRSKNIIKETE